MQAKRSNFLIFFAIQSGYNHVDKKKLNGVVCRVHRTGRRYHIVAIAGTKIGRDRSMEEDAVGYFFGFLVFDLKFSRRRI
jgi:hypothetical protein